MAWNHLSADLSLHIIQYLNVIDSGRLSATSTRCYYLVQEYRTQRGAELVTVSNRKHRSCSSGEEEEEIDGMLRRCIGGLQSKPNLVIAFSAKANSLAKSRSALEYRFSASPSRSDQKLPVEVNTDTIVLCADAPAIQVNNAQLQKVKQDHTPTNSAAATVIEHSSTFSVMAATFPQAKILPFALDLRNEDDDEFNAEMELLKRRLRQDDLIPTWKAMIVYGDIDSSEKAELFVSQMQKLLPHATIVGGMCHAGYVTKPVYSRELLTSLSMTQLRHLRPGRSCSSKKSELVDQLLHSFEKLDPIIEVETGLWGVVLGGEVPVRSVVSRGVRSLLHGHSLPSSSSLVVEQGMTIHPMEEAFTLRRDEGSHPYHIITKIRDTDTEQIMTPADVLAKVTSSAQDMVHFIGIKRRGGDGYELTTPNMNVTLNAGVFVIDTDGSQDQFESLEDAEIDFFSVDGEACMRDMDETVQKLKEQTQGEEILGAIMISCSGRGPKRGYVIPEYMSDAKRFAKGFPKVPCLGFYAGGEIGPMALAGNENVFQTGRAALQGFTAVFALFIVPKVDKREFQLDDCRENVRAFIDKQFMRI